MWVAEHVVDVVVDLWRFFPHLAGHDPLVCMKGADFFMIASRLHCYGGAVAHARAGHAAGVDPALAPAHASAPAAVPPPVPPAQPPGLPQPAPRPPAMTSRDGVVIRPAGEVFTLGELGVIDPSTFEVAAVSA